ncbi:MAG: hypothetical protein QTN59_20215 [Candidatus Electrothrix communis]|nr:MAG: hypothetical protein QTN59_20215 [Candidatus Electrothrix communis]
MPDRNNPFSWTGLLDISAITGIIAALLYTAGWSYAYHYFAHFQIGLLGITIQREYFFMYGFQVFKAHPFWVLLCLGSCAGLYFLIRFLWQLVQNRTADQGVRWFARLRVLGLFGGPFCLLLLFICCSWLGAGTGKATFEREKAGGFSHYPRIKIWKEGKPDAKAKAWAEGCYQLLLRDKDNLYIFLAAGNTDWMSTDIVPTRKVDTVRVMPFGGNLTGCR